MNQRKGRPKGRDVGRPLDRKGSGCQFENINLNVPEFTKGCFSAYLAIPFCSGSCKYSLPRLSCEAKSTRVALLPNLTHNTWRPQSSSTDKTTTRNDGGEILVPD
jgi:hypothetical protein